MRMRRASAGPSEASDTGSFSCWPGGARVASMQWLTEAMSSSCRASVPGAFTASSEVGLLPEGE